MGKKKTDIEKMNDLLNKMVDLASNLNWEVEEERKDGVLKKITIQENPMKMLNKAMGSWECVYPYTSN